MGRKDETLFWKYGDNGNDTDDPFAAGLYRIFCISSGSSELLGAQEPVCPSLWAGDLLPAGVLLKVAVMEVARILQRI